MAHFLVRHLPVAKTIPGQTAHDLETESAGFIRSKINEGFVLECCGVVNVGPNSSWQQLNGMGSVLISTLHIAVTIPVVDQRTDGKN